jgi:hypothetical protein
VRPRRYGALLRGPSTFALDVTETPVRAFSSKSSVALLGLLSMLCLPSCTDHELTRVAVPETNVTLVLTEDEKQMLRYEVLVDHRSALEQGFLGPHDADSSLLPVMTRDGDLVTFTWHGSLLSHFVQFNFATCQLVGDSHGRKPEKIPGCTSQLRGAQL